MFNERMNAKTTVEILTGSDPIIYVNIDAIGKMKEYVDGCSDEIGWLGEVIKDEVGNYIIKDVHLFKQQVHSTTCEITTEGLTEFANEILMQPSGMDKWNDIKCWFHSHVNMGVTPSGQDNLQMNVFKDCGHDFFIRGIANKKGEMEFTLYNYTDGLIYKNVRWAIFYNNTEIYSVQQQIDALQATLRGLQQPSIDKVGIKTEMAKKVTKMVTQYGGYNGYKGVTKGANIVNHMDWYDEYYGVNAGTTVLDTKKKTQSSNPHQVKINMETNEVNGGSNLALIEDEILLAYVDNDYDYLESMFSPSKIMGLAYMNLIAIKQEMFEEYAEHFDESSCQKLKELCLEYATIYNETYGI